MILPFGTRHDLTTGGDEFAFHAFDVKHVGEEADRVVFGGPDCTKPYSVSRLNISPP